MPYVADRVKETSTTTGTGTLNLDGAVSKFVGFVAAIGTGNPCYYSIVHQSAAEWEVGIGTVTDATPDTLSRTTVLASSNAGALVSLSAGSKDVFVTVPAIAVAGKNQYWIGAGEMIPRITNGPSRGFTELATNKTNVETLDFDTTTQEFVQFQRRMPKRWDRGTIAFIPVWTAASGSGGVVFALQAVAVSNDDALDVAMGTEQTSTDTLLAANDSHEGPQSAAITISGTPASGDVILFQVKRNPADGSDTLAVDAKLMGIILVVTDEAGSDD
jgi:hypothetical protein